MTKYHFCWIPKLVHLEAERPWNSHLNIWYAYIAKRRVPTGRQDCGCFWKHKLLLESTYIICLIFFFRLQENCSEKHHKAFLHFSAETFMTQTRWCCVHYTAPQGTQAKKAVGHHHIPTLIENINSMTQCMMWQFIRSQTSPHYLPLHCFHQDVRSLHPLFKMWTNFQFHQEQYFANFKVPWGAPGPSLNQDTIPRGTEASRWSRSPSCQIHVWSFQKWIFWLLVEQGQTNPVEYWPKWRFWPKLSVVFEAIVFSDKLLCYSAELV